jgi:hypothetical protein
LIAQKDAKCETLPAYWRGLLQANHWAVNQHTSPPARQT